MTQCHLGKIIRRKELYDILPLLKYLPSHMSVLLGCVCTCAYVCVRPPPPWVDACLSCCMWWCRVLGSTPSRGLLAAALLSPRTLTTSARTPLTSRPAAYPGTYSLPPQSAWRPWLLLLPSLWSLAAVLRHLPLFYLFNFLGCGFFVFSVVFIYI